MIHRIKSFFAEKDWFNNLLHKLHFKYSFVRREKHEEALSSLEKALPIIAENTNLKETIVVLKEQLERMGEEFKTKDFVVPVDLNDPDPTDREKRKQYVAEVAELYTHILKPKFLFMISNFHNLLEDETNNRDVDNAMKGAVYTLREILRWCKKMYNEQMANVKGQDPSVPDNQLK